MNVFPCANVTGTAFYTLSRLISTILGTAVPNLQL